MKIIKSSAKKLAQSRDWYRKNREKRLTQQKQWQIENPEKVRGYLKTWRDKNRDKLNRINKIYQALRRNSSDGKSHYYKSKFGIDFIEYERLFNEQSGKCAICKKEEINKQLSIDHCHETGRIRGLLCGCCNRALGLLRDDVSLLESCIKYLRDE